MRLFLFFFIICDQKKHVLGNANDNAKQSTDFLILLSVQNDDIRMDGSEWHSQAIEQTLLRETFNLLGYI